MTKINVDYKKYRDIHKRQSAGTDTNQSNVVGTSNQKKGPLNILRHLLHYNGILKTCANIQICFLPLFVIGFCLI